uniref:Uncharacterized protein n=1 Tax=Nannospalax galili TaxID=1026970 RepID=A0A8C6RK94_NANGA
VNEHKKVVLEQLARIDDIKFKMIKSLLNKELHLTDKMQEDYDIIKIANMLEEKFPKDAGVSKLIEVCKNMPLLTTLADRFKEERTKVQNQNKRKSNAAQRKRKQGEPNTSQPESIRDASSKDTPSLKKKKDKTMETEGLEKGKLTQKQNQPSKPAERNTQKREDAAQIPPMTPPTTPSNSAIKKKRKETITTEDFKKMKLTQEQNQLPEPSVTNAMKTEDSHQTLHMPLPISPSNFLTKNQRPPVQTQVGTRITALQRNSITVKVLKATEVFEYESSGWGTNKMFHATVATERQFFHVKVFNINLKEMFSKNNVIIISNYIECKGILEINEASCVLQAGPDQKIEVPNHVIRRANGTPKIDDLLKLAPGTMVYG